MSGRSSVTRQIRFGALATLLAASVLATVGNASVGAQQRPTCEGRPATIIGTPGRDIIEGTPGIDVIVGLGGNDYIRGKGGVDFICGGDGNDTILGGPGSDVIRGGRNKDRIKGGPGLNWIYGDGGSDRLVGGPDPDRLVGGRGRVDRLFGNGGNDRCLDADARTVRRTCENLDILPRCNALFVAPSFLSGSSVETDRNTGCQVITGILDPGQTHTFSFVSPTDADGYRISLDWTSYATGCPIMETANGLAQSCQGASLAATGGVAGKTITVTVGMGLRSGPYQITVYPQNR